MEKPDVLIALEGLRKQLLVMESVERTTIHHQLKARNPWFIPEDVDRALDGIVHLLDPEKLERFLAHYPAGNLNRKVGIIMAGNIPGVGFHDLLCVLLSGHQAIVKLSSDDDILLKVVVNWLHEIDASLASRVRFTEKLVLDELDAVIATGSNNTARYFEQYFSKLPNIIRKSRTSCAVLTGKETVAEFKELAADVLTYFGKGCRNVTKLFVPKGFDFPKMLDEWQDNMSLLDTNRYANNVSYQRSILLVNQEPHLDTGYLLVKEDEALHAPIGVLFYEYYDSEGELALKLGGLEEELQCIVSSHGHFQRSVPFGVAQKPDVDDYADGVDTMEFLSTL